MSVAESDGPSAPSVVERVRDMYTRYPYPPVGSNVGLALFGLLDYARFVLWPGRSLEGLRVLDAGCGTGNTTVQIAVNHPEVEVVGMDLSARSIELAEERARASGLSRGGRLSLRQGSIEDLADDGRPFDYIIAAGVLHHMADPVAGARRLAGLLAPDGGMAVMLYAPHGRHGVYVVQEALRRLVGDLDLASQVTVARQLIGGLPPGHPFDAKAFADHEWAGDAGLVDLLLHVQDRAFSVPQLYDLLDQSGLRLERFLSPRVYRPENYTGNDALRARLAALPEREAAAMAELVCGSMAMHAFFATRSTHRPAHRPIGGGAFWEMRPVRSPLFRWDEVRTRKALVERAVGPLTRTLELDAWILGILERCDGRRTAAEILALPQVRGAIPSPSPEAGKEIFGRIMELLGGEEVLLFEPRG